MNWYWCPIHERVEREDEVFEIDCSDRRQGPFEGIDEAIMWSLPEAFDD